MFSKSLTNFKPLLSLEERKKNAKKFNERTSIVSTIINENDFNHDINNNDDDSFEDNTLNRNSSTQIFNRTAHQPFNLVPKKLDANRRQNELFHLKLKHNHIARQEPIIDQIDFTKKLKLARFDLYTNYL